MVCLKDLGPPFEMSSSRERGLPSLGRGWKQAYVPSWAPGYMCRSPSCQEDTGRSLPPWVQRNSKYRWPVIPPCRVLEAQTELWSLSPLSWPVTKSSLHVQVCLAPFGFESGRHALEKIVMFKIFLKFQKLFAGILRLLDVSE